MKTQHFLWLPMVAGLLTGRAAAPAEEVPPSLMAATKSVVRISVKTPGHPEITGTGFVCQDKTEVVTTLHLVVGAPTISVWFESYGTKAQAALIKKLKSRDLALLKVENPPDAPPLKISDKDAQPGENLTILGYPLGIPSLDSREGKVRLIGGKKIADIVPYDIRNEIENFGMPDVDSAVVNLDAALVPGHSGAPILAASGEVVAIGDGGLEQGGAAMGWAIPAAGLKDLFAAEDSDNPPLPPDQQRVANSLYGAELKAQVGQSVRMGNVRLTKIRTRSFTELCAHVDDSLGLNQLLQALRMQRPDINPEEFRYDVYQDAESGASIVVPAGSELVAKGDHFTVLSADGGLELLIRLYQAFSFDDAVYQSNLMQFLLPMANIQWVPNPAWSQGRPVFHQEGFLIKRTSFSGYQYGQNPNTGMYGSWPFQYAFATVGVRGKTMLGTIAINHHYLSPNNMTEWVRMHLGVQFTTFSQASSGQ